MKYSSEKQRRLLHIIKTHSLLLFVLLAYIFVIGCPLRTLFGIPCPGCGLSRAYYWLLQLDFASAFHYHPLYPIALPVILYISHREAWHLPGGKRAERVIIILTALLFIGVYIYRLATHSDITEIDFTKSVLFRLYKYFFGGI